MQHPAPWFANDRSVSGWWGRKQQKYVKEKTAMGIL